MKSAGQLRVRLMLGDTIALGPGKARLLQAVAETGSITAAAKSMGMSYRRAWMLIDDMNRCFKQPLVETAKGGARGGGASVSEFGRDVLGHYLAMELPAPRKNAMVCRFRQSGRWWCLPLPSARCPKPPGPSAA